jgi:hypothetical protein
MRTLPLLFSFMIGLALLGSPTVGSAQMMTPPSSTNTLGVTNPMVALGTAINTTGSVDINAGTQQLNYSVEFSYFIMGMPARTSIQPAIPNGVLAANATRRISLVDTFTPGVRGMGYVVIEVIDTSSGAVLTRSFKMISVQ